MRKILVMILAILLVGVCLAGCTEQDTKKKNKAPTAEFTVSNQNPTHNELITFDASNSNDTNKKDRDILEFEWDFGDGQKIDKSKGAKKVEHFFKEDGSFEVTLFVYDKKTFTTAVMNLTVTNQPPVIDNYFPQGNASMYELATKEFGINASDMPNDDTLTYQWAIGGTDLAGETSKNFFYIPGLDDEGTVDLTVRVQDGNGGMIFQAWTVEVLDTNQAPVINAWDPINDISVSEMAVQVFSVTASDPDGDPLTYAWFINDVMITGESGTSYSYKPDYNASGSYVIKVAVSDGDLVTERSWNVTVTNSNRPPVIVTSIPTTPIFNMNETDTVILSITASDPDGDEMTYSWTQDSDQLIDALGPGHTFEPGLDDAGEHALVVTVADGKGGTDSHQWTITVDNLNQAPVINSKSPTTNPTMDEMQTQEFSVTASDPDGDLLTYTWFVNGTEVAGETASTFSFTPDYTMGGTSSKGHTVSVSVKDPSMEEAVEDWTVTVNNVNRPPVASGSVNMSKPGIGLEVEFDASASNDPDNDVLSYIWDFGDVTSPQGGNPITHTYKNPGIYTVKVTASDGDLEDVAELVVDVNYTEVWMSASMGEIGPVLVDDIDGDGTKEIIFGGLDSDDADTYTGFLYVFDAKTRTQEWKSNDIGLVQDITIGNVDADGNKEIIVGTLKSMSSSGSGFIYHGRVYAFDGVSHAEDFNSGDIGSVFSVEVSDLDGDTTIEIIGAYGDSFAMGASILDYWGNVTVWGWDGANVVEEWTSTDFDGFGRFMILGDLDGDSTDEVYVGCIDEFTLATGTSVGRVAMVNFSTTYDVRIEVTGFGMISSMAVGDPDKDLNDELLVGDYVVHQADHMEGYLYVLDDTLGQEWKSNDVGVPTTIIVSDADGDNINEIIFGTYYNDTEDPNNSAITLPEGFLYILNGATHNQKFKSNDIGAVSSMAIGNLDESPTLEIVVGTWEREDAIGNYDGYIYVFFYNQSTTSFQQLWRSRNVNQIGLGAIVIDDLDDDGFMDFVVGTTEKSGSPFSGKLYIYTNKSSNT